MRTGPISCRGLKSVAQIFSALLARKSSCFARILHYFLGPKMENGYLNNSRGGGGGCIYCIYLRNYARHMDFGVKLLKKVQEGDTNS